MQFKIRILLALLCLGMLSCFRDGQQARKLPIEAFFESPVKTSYLISPDGASISYLKSYKNRLNLFVESFDGNSVRRLTSDSSNAVTAYFWASSSELLYMKDKPDDSGVSLIAIDKNGGTSEDLLPEGKYRVKLINASRLRNNELLLAINKRDSSVFDVYRLNIARRELRIAAINPGNITDWYADEDSRLRLAIASDGVNETLLYRDHEGEQFRPVVTSNFKTTINPIGFSGEDPDRIYALSNQNRDKMALVEFNCRTGKESREIFSHPDVDVVEGGYSVSKRKIMYATYETWKKQKHYLDDSIKYIYEELEKLLPNSEIRIYGRDSAEKKFIIRTFTDKSPGAFYRFTLGSRQLVKLSDVNAALPETEMCDMKPVSFTSRDGLTISGYLTLPKGQQTTDLPVVVIPHSNPEIRNTWNFSSEVQFLANRGYAVFQVNYRGTKGYGKQFWTAGFKQWGLGIQNDITDGVNWLVAQKIADPKRIAIYGSSFGGYSALMGLGDNPKLYRCGISSSGLINLFTYMKGLPAYYKPFLQMSYEKVGNPEKDADYFMAVSPLFHAERIKVPLLIVQGGKDPRVNVNETNQFVKKLRKRGIPVTYMVKEDEAHSLRKPENRLEFYRTLEKFLAENLNKK